MINITTSANMAFVVQIAFTLQFFESIIVPTVGATIDPNLPTPVAQPRPVPLISAGYEMAARPMRPELLPITKNPITADTNAIIINVLEAKYPKIKTLAKARKNPISNILNGPNLSIKTPMDTVATTAPMLMHAKPRLNSWDEAPLFFNRVGVHDRISHSR